NGLIEFFESPTLTNNGTALTCRNNDRQSEELSTLTHYYDPTVSADGTRLLVNVVGTDGTTPQGDSGGATKRDNEFILKPNTSYLVKFTTQTNDNRISCCAEHYQP
ncbi:MAG: hypothetical protein V2I33_22845, partial [Kangiellaceae bacterium]|nr:hypothetical protein [Kangiellaceae bacterium]